jgi:hypothetical protein
VYDARSFRDVERAEKDRCLVVQVFVWWNGRVVVYDVRFGSYVYRGCLVATLSQKENIPFSREAPVARVGILG